LRILSLVVGIIFVLSGLFFLIQAITDEFPLLLLGFPLMGISIVLIIGAILIKNGVDMKKSENLP